MTYVLILCSVLRVQSLNYRKHTTFFLLDKKNFGCDCSLKTR
jgi:hypothetical protein